MGDFDRILTAYEHRQTQVVDDLMAELDASAGERARLRLVAQLVQSIIHTFGTFEADRAAVVDSGSSATSAAAGREPEQSLNVSLRSLVDSGGLTAWQARFINLNLGLRRSVLVSGASDNGRSTLLNALVGLLPSSHRLVFIDNEGDVLPVMQERRRACGGRSDVVQIAADAGSPARAKAVHKAAGMKPDWIVIGELAVEDGPPFLEALQGSCGGLATIPTIEPEAQLNEWLLGDRKMADRLARVKPLVLNLREERGDQPSVIEVMEVAVKDGTAVLTPHTGLT